MGNELDPRGFELLLQRLAVEESSEQALPLPDDVSRQRAGEKYRLLWEKLDTYFERNGCVDHENAADEVLLRVIAAILEKEIRNLMAYSYGVARLVKLEFLRKQRRFEPLPDRPEDLGVFLSDESSSSTEEVTQLMKDCFSQLPSEEQELMTRYVNTERGGKQKLADEFGLSLQVIQQKVFKIRKRLREGLDVRLGRAIRKAPTPA